MMALLGRVRRGLGARYELRVARVAWPAVRDLLRTAPCVTTGWENTSGGRVGSLGLGARAIQHLMIHTALSAKHTHTHTYRLSHLMQLVFLSYLASYRKIEV